MFFPDINECSASVNPCQNGGQCVNAPGSYDCDCSQGYSGLNCQTGRIKILTPVQSQLILSLFKVELSEKHHTRINLLSILLAMTCLRTALLLCTWVYCLFINFDDMSNTVDIRVAS